MVESGPLIIVDVNVGKLVKWLRVLGYDAIISPILDDGQMLQTARQQGRVLITRDTYIPDRKVVKSGQVEVLLLRSDDFREQMREVMVALELNTSRSFSRCIECNAGLAAIDRALVRDRVPEFVFDNNRQFSQCPVCSKLYWRGTHWRNMVGELADMMKGS